jgi:hypothetical protein
MCCVLPLLLVMSKWIELPVIPHVWTFVTTLMPDMVTLFHLSNCMPTWLIHDPSIGASPVVVCACRPKREAPMDGVAWVRQGPGITMLKRIKNEGMDFAAHNTSLAYAMASLKSMWLSYSYYIFLNSSVQGPLLPKYFRGHWSQPYTSRIVGNVKAVGSSIVCLPDVDAGAPITIVDTCLRCGFHVHGSCARAMSHLIRVLCIFHGIRNSLNAETKF